MKIHLNESTFYRLILMEDKRIDRARAQSLQVIRDYFARRMPYFNLEAIFYHEDNPDRLSNLNYMFKQFEGSFFHNPNVRASQIMRLEPAFVKMAFDAGFQQGHNDSRRLNRIEKIIEKMYHMAKASPQEAKVISKMPLDVSFEELNARYGKIIDDENAAETERINGTEYEENHSYRIIGPVDFNTAHKFAPKTGDMENTSTMMCYGMFRSTWEDYTADDKYAVYICLRDDYDKLEPVFDDNSHSADDSYGLSMIWVIVDEDGDLAYCNTRWNHGTKDTSAEYRVGRSCDHALSREEISNIVGRNFMKTFMPF